MLFGNDNNCLQTPTTREFYSTDRKQVRQYLVKRHHYLTIHNFEARLALLEDHWDPTLAEQLDQDFQKSAAQSAAKCKRKPNVAYVEKLATACKEKNVLRQILSQRKTGIDYITSLAHLTRDACPFVIPVSPEECQHCCKHLKKLIHQYEKSATMLRQEELSQCL